MALNEPWESGWRINEKMLGVSFYLFIYFFHFRVIFNHVQTITYLSMSQHL